MTNIVTSSFGLLSTKCHLRRTGCWLINIIQSINHVSKPLHSKWTVLSGQLVWQRGTLVTNFDGHSEIRRQDYFSFQPNRVSCLTRHTRNMEHGRTIGKSYVWPVETLETPFVKAIIIIFWRWVHIYQVGVPTISLLNGNTLVSLEASNQPAGNDHQQTIFKSLGSLCSQHCFCMDGLHFWSPPPRSVLISNSRFSVYGHSHLWGPFTLNSVRGSGHIK